MVSYPAHWEADVVLRDGRPCHLRPITPDDDPILGEAPHLCGFFNDCGWGGHGIMQAPAAGMALAEWIVDGAPVSLDLSHFGAERFMQPNGPADR